MKTIFTQKEFKVGLEYIIPHMGEYYPSTFLCEDQYGDLIFRKHASCEYFIFSKEDMDILSSKNDKPNREELIKEYQRKLDEYAATIKQNPLPEKMERVVFDEKLIEQSLNSISHELFASSVLAIFAPAIPSPG